VKICSQCRFLPTPGLRSQALSRDTASFCHSSSCETLSYFDCFCAKWLNAVMGLMLAEFSLHNSALADPTCCMNLSREFERQRINRMSVEERICFARRLKE